LQAPTLALTAFVCALACGPGEIIPLYQGQSPLSLYTLSPQSAVASSGSFDLTVNGAGFTSSAVVYLGLTAEPTSFIDSSKIIAHLPDQSVAGTYLVSVQDPASGQATTISLELQIDGASKPPPTDALSLTQLDPNFAQVSPLGLTVVATGTGFTPSTVLHFN